VKVDTEQLIDVIQGIAIVLIGISLWLHTRKGR
jgi:hypothetical protein